MNSISQLVPSSLNGWYRSDTVRQIDSSNIFEYMNGGGELYLGYRFNKLEILEYFSEDKNTIIVEIYEMDTGDDAFGLLSLDWSGEAVFFDEQFDSSAAFMAPTTRALYGSGLLRLVSGSYYMRIMAFRETTNAKNTVLQIGKLLYKNNVSEPEIIQRIPVLENLGWKMNHNKIAFFRSHMVLNSLFYLSHQNILNLDNSVSAVTVTYDTQQNDTTSKSIQLFMLRYTNNQKAIEALNHFSNAYLPEFKLAQNTNDPQFSNYYLIEDGWLGCKLADNLLTLVFNIPDKSSAEKIINHIKLNKYNGE